jgi:hypothetical protein
LCTCKKNLRANFERCHFKGRNSKAFSPLIILCP